MVKQLSPWCYWWDLNPQSSYEATDFKSVVYANSTTIAYLVLHFGLEPKRLSAMVLEAIVSANSTNEAYTIRHFIHPTLWYGVWGLWQLNQLIRVFKLMHYQTLYVKHRRLERHQNQLHASYLTYIMNYIILVYICQEVFWNFYRRWQESNLRFSFANVSKGATFLYLSKLNKNRPLYLIALSFLPFEERCRSH